MKDFTYTQVRRIPRLKSFTGLTFVPCQTLSSGIRLIFPEVWRNSFWHPTKSSQTSDLIQYDTFLPVQEHSGVWNWLRHCISVLMPEGWSHHHSCSWRFKSWLETTFQFHSCRVNFQPEKFVISSVNTNKELVSGSKVRVRGENHPFP